MYAEVGTNAVRLPRTRGDRFGGTVDEIIMRVVAPHTRG